MKNDDFKIIIPAELTKSKNGEWNIAGLASTGAVDKQGEILMQKGLDLTPIDAKKGFFNWDHDNSPENTIGIIDGYQQSDNGLFVKGRLFKNHSRAKAVKEIMDSLGNGDTGRVGMSVEGKIVSRNADNPSIIEKCIIKNVALTMNPVNAETYTDIVKSLSAKNLEFDSVEGQTTTKTDDSKEPTFTTSQVIDMVQKALGLSGESQAPVDRTGGDALQVSNMSTKKKKKDEEEPKTAKEGLSPIKLVKSEYQSNMLNILGNLQTLYPDYSRAQIWNAVKDRLNTQYPELQD